MGNKLNKDNVSSFLAKILAAQSIKLNFEIEDIYSIFNQSLLDIGLYDSLSFLDLLVDIEDEFNIEVELFSYEPSFFTTPNGLIEIVSNQIEIASPQTKLSSHLNAESISYEIMDKNHLAWNQIASLYKEMYNSFEDKGLKMKLKEGGEKIWLSSLEKTIGRTNHIISCFHEQTMIAFIHGSIKLLPSYYEEETVGYIGGIYIIPEWRSKKIGDQLILLLEEWFKKNKINSIELQVLVNNNPALAFWKKNGFVSELIQMRK